MEIVRKEEGREKERQREKEKGGRGDAYKIPID